MADYQNIPTELRQPPLWLQYYLSPDPKRPDKKPRKHPCVKYATAEDRAANLRSLDYLIKERPAPKKGGGYQRYVQPGEGLVYIDVDKCRNPQSGEVKSWAAKVIESLDTYTEISASGCGFHLVARGALGEDFKLDPNPVEIYSGHIPNKLMALTGNVYDLKYAIEPRQEKLNELLKAAKEGKFGTPKPTSRGLVQKTESIVVDEPSVNEEAGSLPAFPRLPGPLGILVEGITSDLPYDHKALAAITYMGIGLARRVALQPDHWLQPRFYSCMVGPPGSAKSAAEFEVRRALCEGQSPILRELAVEFSIDSGPALV
jgi:hypothetical protein